MSENTPDIRPFQEFNSDDAEKVAELEQVNQVMHEILQDGYRLSQIRFSLKESAVVAADHYVNNVRKKVIDCPYIGSTEISISGQAITIPNIEITSDTTGVNIRLNSEVPSRLLDVFEELEVVYNSIRYNIRDEDGTYGMDNESNDGFFIEPEMTFGIANPDHLRLVNNDQLRENTYLLSAINVIKMAYADLSGGVSFTIPELEQIRRRYEILSHERFSDTDAQKVVSAFQSLDEALKTTDASSFKFIDDIKDIFKEVHSYSQKDDTLLYPTINALEEVIGRQRLVLIEGQAAVNKDELDSTNGLVDIAVHGNIQTIIQGNPYTDDKNTIHIVLIDDEQTYYIPITKVYSLGY